MIGAIRIMYYVSMEIMVTAAIYQGSPRPGAQGAQTLVEYGLISREIKIVVAKEEKKAKSKSI